MKIEKCEFNLGTNIVAPCDPCRKTRFKRRVPIQIGKFILYVTYTYEVRNCFVGFTWGDFLYALTLLPKEEQEVEIIRKEKYERSSHEERSAESEFESEFMNTFRIENSLHADSNFSSSAEAGGSFFGLFGASANVNSSTSAGFSSNVFNETVIKTATKVSNYYDVAIDIKSELENQFRSLRKISNPNACKVVTYFFKQLNKKYKIEIALVDVRFDIITVTPTHNLTLLPYYTQEFKAVASPVSKELLASRHAAVNTAFINNPTEFRAYKNAENPAIHYAAVNALEVLKPRTLETYKELTLDEVNEKMKLVIQDNKNRDLVAKELKVILSKPENKLNFIIFTTEYCLRTNSVIAEPKVSDCSICECDDCECEENKVLKELEIEKLKTEIELLKKQLKG